jgi:hypothetical protein
MKSTKHSLRSFSYYPDKDLIDGHKINKELRYGFYFKLGKVVFFITTSPKATDGIPYTVEIRIKLCLFWQFVELDYNGKSRFFNSDEKAFEEILRICKIAYSKPKEVL